MTNVCGSFLSRLLVAIVLTIAFVSLQANEAPGNGRKVFGKGAPFTLNELPSGQLKAKLQALPPKARGKAMKWLHSFTFSAGDAAHHIHADKDGGIYYACPDNAGKCTHHSHGDAAASTPAKEETKKAEKITASPAESSTKSGEPVVSKVSVPVSSPPVHNSKPGAPFHIYIDVNGGHVPNTTAWGGPAGGWDCRPWSPNDSDETTFSDAEQANIKRIWERIAEDYASFDVNVTTDITYDPDNYTGDKNKVGWLMVTPTTDANGNALPHNGAGGVAYVGVFGNSNFYSQYQPAWTTPMGVANTAEAASHEMGHNMGLSHDGTSTLTYYGGHVATANAPSWGPIMGTGYNRNVSQWCKGEYFDANRTQDDLAIIAGRVTYRTDDYGDDNANAFELVINGDGSFSQDGIIERTGEVDVFSFATGAGSITVNVDPYRCDTQTWGGNLDAILELYNTGGTLIATSNPLANVNGSITTTVAAGTYFVHIKPTGAGDPMNSSRSGYTVYGSVGQYTVSGNCILPGVGVIETAGTTDVTEGTGSDTYALVLGTQPTDNVTVTITADPQQLTVDKPEVTFTPTNWDTQQVVTVTAFDDTIEEGPHTSAITHTSSSNDPAFNAIGVASVVANITDNDYIAVTSPNGGESWLAGTMQPITWFSLMTGNVTIDLLKNNTYFSTIVDNIPASSGSYNWNIPTNQTPGLNYQIRITSMDVTSTSDASDAYFSILPQPTEFYYEPLDSNPGWNLGTSWAYGQPTGQGQDTYGAPDPTSGFNGTNVLGYRLDGDYEGSITSTRYATTTAIDCSNYANIKLQFQRWLGVESSTYDHAYIEVSNDGSSWNQVWANGTATIDDASWRLVEYDISTYADTQATVYIRWGMGTTDSSWNYCGWNIDEIKLFGSSLTPTVGVSVTQTGGSTDVIEGGAPDTYSLVLLSAPTADVTIAIGTDAQLDPITSVTFSSTNWDQPQNVNVTAIDDGLHELAHTGSITHTVTSTDTAYDGIGVDGVLVNITDINNQPPNVVTNPYEQTVYLDGVPAANPVAGANIFLDATLDDGANATWEDSLGTWNPTIDTGVTWVADAGSSLAGITSAYNFPGGVSGAGGCDGPALQDMGVDTQPITLEIWFKPVASGSYPANGQILWETGGGTGLGIFYNNGFVETAHDSNQAQISADVSALTGEFIQVVVTYDPTSASNNFNLYINGVLQVSASRSDNDMCGGDDSGLGNKGQSNAGGAGSGDASTESFEGQIAIFRSYHNRALNEAEVLQNYNSVAGSGVVATITGTGTTDPDGDPLTYSWVRESGPAEVTIDSPTSLITTATFTAEGDYKMVITADDTAAQASKECWVYVRTGGPGVIISQSAGSTDVTEGGATDTYTVKLNSEPTANVEVTLTPDADVTVSPTTPLIFTPLNFDQPQTVTVTAFDDLIDEGAHTGTITHSATSGDPLYDGITIPDVVANVTDDDSPGVIALKSSSYGIGENGPTVTLLVSRTGGTAGAVSVNYATADITATGDIDYLTSNGTLNWAEDDSADKSIVITINDDLDPETNESFSVTLSGIVDATLGSPNVATVTISDDDEPGTIALATSTYTVDESGGSVAVTLTRTGGNAGEATVDYSMLGQSATANADFGSGSGTVTWPAGDDTDKTIVIAIVDDLLPESDETFDVMLSNATIAALGAPSTATVTITDNDFGPQDITGLVGWYDAQAITDLNGTSITTWADSSGLGNDLTHATNARKLTPVAPKVQSVSLNGATFKSVRFIPGLADEYELLRATGLTVEGDSSRSMFVVYKGGVDDAASRPISFGAINGGSNKAHKKVWGLATDGNGTMQFEGNGQGLKITGYSAGLDRAQFVIRTAVMESINSFDEYIDVLDSNYTETQVMSNGNPKSGQADIGATEGDFYIGDSAAGSEGAGGADATFDILEVIVYDKILSALERGQVQDYLKAKYCPPTSSVSVAATDNIASEPGTNTGTWTITRTGDTTNALDVNFTLSGASAADYQPITSPVTIGAGLAEATVTLIPVDDAEVEGDEVVTLSITADAAYTVGSPANDSITIQDDDVSSTFTLTYNAGPGGSITGITPQTVDFGLDGSPVTASPNTGYSFVNWSDASTDNPRQDLGVTQDITVTANFSANSYTVTFDAQGGTAPSPATKSVTFDSAYGALATTSRTGYTFNGWFDAPIGGTEVTAATIVSATADHTLYAQWTINTYTLTYTAGAGGSITGTSPQTIDHGADGTSVTAVPDTGYSFVDWSDTSTVNPRTDTNVTADINVTANFSANSYTVTFEGNGGTAPVPATKSVTFDAAYGALATSSRTGYTFNGWFDAPTGGTEVTAATIVNTASNHTLYAQWTINQYTITFNSNGGSVVSPITQDYGAAVAAPADPTRTGYTFSGWSPAVPATMPANNTTCVAQWTINQYTLTYTAGAGGSISGTSPQTVDYGTDGTAVTAVPDAGYEFIDWSDASTANPRQDTNVQGNITVTANFQVATYNVTYDGNGSTGGTVPTDATGYALNDTVTVLGPGTLTRPPYVFGGWNTAADGGGLAYAESDTFSITGDITLFAQWQSGPTVIYEPFDDSDPTLSGNTPGTGLTGTWDASASVTAGSLSFGSLPAGSGNRAEISSQHGGVLVNGDLASSGLLADGTELWFSILVQTGGDIATNGDLGFAFGTERISGSNNLPIINSGVALGFTFKNNQLRASHWTAGPTLTRSSTNSGNGAAPNTLYLVVGKFTWGTVTDTLEIYNVPTDLTLGTAVSTYSTTVDQSLFDTISFASKAATPAHEFDEIRFGSTYESVIGQVDATTVAGTEIFYNNSSWDGDAGASANDDLAIASTKSALLPGGTATFDNYTSYDKGINGIMVDVNGSLPGTLDAANDFEFRIGNDNDPTGWTLLAGTNLPDVTVTADGGGAGIDRITLIWPEANAPKKTWLQVTVLASGNVGLASDYVFYYGNAIGEVGNSATDGLVNASDALGMRANPKSIGTATLDDVYDCNRDKAVNATDVLRSRSNATTTSTMLQLITVP